jgi:UDP-2-acetamido-2,6-beta-L-arabino-hexul-4-ose reductase
MKTILITGAEGFVGRNLRVTLEAAGTAKVLVCDVDTSRADLFRDLALADVVVHLAGINRPQSVGEFAEGNAGFTDVICSQLEALNRNPTILFSSSVQAALDNPYGQSKREAEERLKQYAARTGAAVSIFRFTNIFGKWCRPNYNSVVATFCHNVAHELPLVISDPAKEMDLVYIDDVVKSIVARIEEVGGNFSLVVTYPEVSPVHRITLGALADLIRSFRESRKTLVLPDVGDPFIHALYSTYLTYLDPVDFGYGLNTRTDNRGDLAEFVRTRSAGQMFVSRTHPGITRGHHFHHTKTEKFLVVEGEAIIRFRPIQGVEITERKVSGGRWEVVDIPPGNSHSIENVGKTELVTLFWASEPFDPDKPDTYSEKVEINGAEKNI